ncbi:MAG: DedA family protein [Pseudomonadota bacterium]
MTAQFIEWISTLTPFMAVGLVLLVLLLCGMGLPLPEEIPIISAAYLAYEGDVGLVPAIMMVIVAVLVGDTILYSVGRRYGNRIFTIFPFRNLVTPERMKKANQRFHRWGNRVVFVARFIAGLRATVFLTAGILRMPYRRFILLDSVAALISIPLNMIIVNYVLHYVGDEPSDAVRAMHRTGRSALIVVLLLVAAFSAIVYFRRKRQPGENVVPPIQKLP